MRSSARDTPARSCARSVLCRPAFPLVPALRSTNSAAAGAALFAGFSRRMPPAFVRIATISGSDFSCPCIIGYGSSPSRRGPDNPRAARSDMRSPRFRPAPFMRDGVFDHDGVSAPRIAAPPILPSAQGDGLGLRHFQTFAAQYPTPHNCCVRFVAAVAGGPRNTRYRAGASPYPDRTCTGWIRSAYPVAPPQFLALGAAAAVASIVVYELVVPLFVDHPAHVAAAVTTNTDEAASADILKTLPSGNEIPARKIRVRPVSTSAPAHFDQPPTTTTTQATTAAPQPPVDDNMTETAIAGRKAAWQAYYQA